MIEPIPYIVARQIEIDEWWYVPGLVMVRFEHEGVGYQLPVPEEMLEDEPALQGTMRAYIARRGTGQNV